MRCFCCLHLLIGQKHLRLCLTPVVVSGESSYKEHLGSDTLSRVCRKGGRRVRNDIAHETKTLGMSLPEIANQPRDGALQAGASTIALALASAFLAFGLTLVWATISSEVVRTLTQDGKAEALGLVSRRLLGAP